MKFDVVVIGGGVDVFVGFVVICGGVDVVLGVVIGGGVDVVVGVVVIVDDDGVDGRVNSRVVTLYWPANIGK